jgi:hypothetical protein
LTFTAKQEDYFVCADWTFWVELRQTAEPRKRKFMVHSQLNLSNLKRVASIATQPKRLNSFQKALYSILPQVDLVYVYLDHFDLVPEFLKNNDKIRVYRAEDCGDLHATSRFLVLKALCEPALVFIFDDDIIYPPDYADKLSSTLLRMNGLALVGVHGRTVNKELKSYVRDTSVIHFERKLEHETYVDVVGAGTCIFLSSVFDLNLDNFSNNIMDDIFLAGEAFARGLPRVVVSRPEGWLKSAPGVYETTLWALAKSDDSLHTKVARKVLKLRPENYSKDLLDKKLHIVKK